MINNQLTSTRLAVKSELDGYKIRASRGQATAMAMVRLFESIDRDLEELQERRKAAAEPVVPATLPCSVELKPGLIIGKGCKTETLLVALQRRADYYAELDAMTPEERAERDANIAAFKTMLPQPAPVVPVVPVVPDDVLDALQKVARIRLDMNDFDGDRRGIAECLGDAEEALIEVVNRRAAMLQELQKSAGAEVICRSNENVQALNTIKATPALGSLPKTDEVQNTNSPVIPDGYVMVPVEPNGDMLAAAQDAYGETDGDIANTLRAAMLAAAPQSPGSEPATVPGKWIPVSERMPENDGAYLCWDNRYVTTYAFIFGAWQANQFVAKNITHWMPLPAAPQEVQGE